MSMIYGKVCTDAPSATLPALQPYAYDSAREEAEVRAARWNAELLCGPPELTIVPIGRSGNTMPMLVWAAGFEKPS